MMTDPDQNANAAPPSARLEEFQTEVAKLKVTGGGANPGRSAAAWINGRPPNRDGRHQPSFSSCPAPLRPGPPGALNGCSIFPLNKYP